MMTIANAEAALKTVYLNVISNQLNNNVNPVYAQIKKSSENIVGKEIKVSAPFGIKNSFKSGAE
ncbi:MAG: hypothetical protein FWE62_06895, partial [Firmicutes bacterium]|nr:hypothetical protein [Bacillota bacterium]